MFMKSLFLGKHLEVEARQEKKSQLPFLSKKVLFFSSCPEQPLSSYSNIDYYCILLFIVFKVLKYFGLSRSHKIQRHENISSIFFL